MILSQQESKKPFGDTVVQMVQSILSGLINPRRSWCEVAFGAHQLEPGSGAQDDGECWPWDGPHGGNKRMVGDLLFPSTEGELAADVVSAL